MKNWTILLVGILAVLMALGTISCQQGEETAQQETGVEGQAEPGAQGEVGEAAPMEPVNVNTASAEDLASIPGLDQTLAQNIIDYRQANGPFSSVDDLMQVSGMDQQTLDSIRGWITAEQAGGMPGQTPEQSPEQMPEQSPGTTGGSGV